MGRHSKAAWTTISPVPPQRAQPVSVHGARAGALVADREDAMGPAQRRSTLTTRLDHGSIGMLNDRKAFEEMTRVDL
jgi:hypothetical protein